MSVSGILQIYDQLPAFGELVNTLQAQQPVPALLLPKGARPSILAKLYLERHVPIVLLTGRVESAAAWIQALEMWLPEGDVMRRLPEPTPLPNDRGPWSDRCRAERIAVLMRLMAGQQPNIPALPQPPLIVASARAFLQKTLPKRQFVSATRALRVGQIIDLEKLTQTWLDVGYEATPVVEKSGQFSRRGGIVDIFPVAAPYPVRIELFGDEIETMRWFDPATQRTLTVNGSADITGMVIPPSREALPAIARDYADTLPNDCLPDEGAQNLPSWQDDIKDLQSGRSFPNLEYYLPLLYPQPASLLDYLPENALVVVDDWPELVTAVAEIHEHADIIRNEQPDLPPGYTSPLFSWDKMSDELNWWQPLILGDQVSSDQVSRKDLTPDHLTLEHLALASAFDPGPRYGGQMRPLMTQLKSAQKDGERTIIVSRQAARLADLWQQENRSTDQSTITPSSSPPSPNYLASEHLTLDHLTPEHAVTFINGALLEGFTLVNRENNRVLLNLLTDAEIFGWKRPAPRRWRQAAPSAPETHFADIQAGDFVVHLEYGVGRFQGLVVRNIGGMEREYLLLEYANRDVLYVPVHHADRLSKWIGSDERPPNVNRLGEKSWQQAKVQAQKAADELAGELLELYSARALVHGHAFAKDADWQAELEASFPYRETEDQLRVIAEVKVDMERP